MSEEKPFHIQMGNGKTESFKDGYEMWTFFMKEKNLSLKQKSDSKAIREIFGAESQD